MPTPVAFDQIWLHEDRNASVQEPVKPAADVDGSAEYSLTEALRLETEGPTNIRGAYPSRRRSAMSEQGAGSES